MNKFRINIIAVLLSFCSFIYAQTYYVSTTGSNTTGNGTQNNPWRTITFALTKVDTSTIQKKTIFAYSGNYSQTTNGEEFPLNLVSNLILMGEDSSNTILDASINEFDEVNRRVINCININSVQVENFTITGGKALLDSLGNLPIGGGIYISNSKDIVLTKSMIKENEASNGTGYGANGGGIAIEYSEKILIVNNEVSDNLSIGDGCNGGGIFVRWSKVLIRDNIVKGNVTWGLFGSAGGGISIGNWEDSTYIVGNEILSNEASTAGGGIYFSSLGIIARNTITENKVGEESFIFGSGGGIAVSYHPCIVGGGVKNSNNVFANIGEITSPEYGTQITTYDLEDTIDARFNFWGANIDPDDTTQIYGKLFIEPLVKNFAETDSSDLIIAPSPVVIDTNLMSGIYKQKIGFYNVSKSLTDSIEIFSITSKNGLVDISKINFFIDAISEDSVSLTFNVNEILLNKDTINVLSSEGDYLITFYVLGEDSTTSINQNCINTPTQFELYQNFPNPFNPVTTIKYSVATTSKINLVVYDILGREIETLINDEKLPGNYRIQFDGSNLSSGVYFCMMKVDNPSTNSGQSFIEIKKLVLLK